MHATLPDFTGASQQLSDPKLPAEPGFYIRFGFHCRSPFSLIWKSAQELP
jgi:hypothetical protein